MRSFDASSSHSTSFDDMSWPFSCRQSLRRSGVSLAAYGLNQLRPGFDLRPAQRGLTGILEPHRAQKIEKLKKNSSLDRPTLGGQGSWGPLRSSMLAGAEQHRCDTTSAACRGLVLPFSVAIFYEAGCVLC